MDHTLKVRRCRTPSQVDLNWLVVKPDEDKVDLYQVQVILPVAVICQVPVLFLICCVHSRPSKGTVSRNWKRWTLPSLWLGSERRAEEDAVLGCPLGQIAKVR